MEKLGPLAEVRAAARGVEVHPFGHLSGCDPARGECIKITEFVLRKIRRAAACLPPLIKERLRLGRRHPARVGQREHGMARDVFLPEGVRTRKGSGVIQRAPEDFRCAPAGAPDGHLPVLDAERGRESLHRVGVADRVLPATRHEPVDDLDVPLPFRSPRPSGFQLTQCRKMVQLRLDREKADRTFPFLKSRPRRHPGRIPGAQLIHNHRLPRERETEKRQHPVRADRQRHERSARSLRADDLRLAGDRAGEREKRQRIPGGPPAVAGDIHRRMHRECRQASERAGGEVEGAPPFEKRTEP